MKSRELRL